MPNGKGMSKEERTAWSIAKQFLEAVRRLETFTGDPDIVLDEIKFVSRREPDNVRNTMLDIYNALNTEVR